MEMNSPQSSYHSAEEAPSSQLSLAPDDDAEASNEKPQYRSARQLPYELRHHCLVYLEEQLYANALTLLNNLLVSGTSYPTPPLPAYIPPPIFISLTSTLLVHPVHTTRASSKELLGVSSHAFNYLQNLLSVVGPVNANLNEAFTISERRRPRQKRKSRSHGRRTRENNSESSDESDEEIITSVLANEGSIWARADDFWQIVGWTFNCSIKHRKRWEYWKVWLEYMLDVIEADWKERDRLGSKDPEMLEDSILFRYMAEHGKSNKVKRAVKSIFAGGSSESMRLFPEVFENETKDLKLTTRVDKTSGRPVDIEKDNYGDYLDNDEYDGNDSFNTNGIPSSEEDLFVVRPHSTGPVTDHAITMGGPDAMALRLRLMAVLSQACDTFPDKICNCSDLYTLFYDHIRPLPIPTFTLFISPSARAHLPSIALSSLVQLHLRRLLATNAPLSSAPDDSITQETLETCFLPFPANTSSAEDNAKVSLLVETLFRLFCVHCDVDSTPALRDAVEKGIEAREAKITNDRRRKPGSERSRADEKDRSYLEASAERLRSMLEAVERKAKRAEKS